MISPTGRSPETAAPSTVPTIACSEIGVSRTRGSPNRWKRPSVALKTPPAAPTSSPMQDDPGVGLHLVAERPDDGFPVRHRRASRARRPYVVEPAVGRGVVPCQGAIKRGADRRRGALAGCGQIVRRGRAGVGQGSFEGRDRVVLLPVLELAVGAIGGRIGPRVAPCAGRSGPRSGSGPLRRPPVASLGAQRRAIASTSFPSTTDARHRVRSRPAAPARSRASSRRSASTRRRGCSRRRTARAASRSTPGSVPRGRRRCSSRRRRRTSAKPTLYPETATRSALPQANGSCEPTIANDPCAPTDRSVRCIDPPRPAQQSVGLAQDLAERPVERRAHRERRRRGRGTCRSWCRPAPVPSRRPP